MVGEIIAEGEAQPALDKRAVNYAVRSISLTSAMVLGSIIGFFTGVWLFLLMIAATTALMTQIGGAGMLGLVGTALVSAETVKTFVSFAVIFTLIGLLTGVSTALLYNIVLSKRAPVRLMLEEVV